MQHVPATLVLCTGPSIVPPPVNIRSPGFAAGNRPLFRVTAFAGRRRYLYPKPPLRAAPRLSAAETRLASRNPPWQAGAPPFVLEPDAMVVFTIPPTQG